MTCYFTIALDIDCYGKITIISLGGRNKSHGGGVI
jgi:hypothetical protein